MYRDLLDLIFLILRININYLYTSTDEPSTLLKLLKAIFFSGKPLTHFFSPTFHSQQSMQTFLTDRGGSLIKILGPDKLHGESVIFLRIKIN